MVFDLIEMVILEFRVLLGECLFIGSLICNLYSYDVVYVMFVQFDVVVFLEIIEEVLQIVKICVCFKCFVVFYGVGIFLEGQVVLI